MVFQLSQVTMIIYCPEPERYRKCGKIRWRTHSFSLLLSVIGELEKPLNESPNHNSHKFSLGHKLTTQGHGEYGGGRR